MSESQTKNLMTKTDKVKLIFFSKEYKEPFSTKLGYFGRIG